MPVFLGQQSSPLRGAFATVSFSTLFSVGVIISSSSRLHLSQDPFSFLNARPKYRGHGTAPSACHFHRCVCRLPGSCPCPKCISFYTNYYTHVTNKMKSMKITLDFFLLFQHCTQPMTSTRPVDDAPLRTPRSYPLTEGHCAAVLGSVHLPSALCTAPSP